LDGEEPAGDAGEAKAAPDAAEDCICLTVLAQSGKLARVEPLPEAPPGFVQGSRLGQVDSQGALAER